MKKNISADQAAKLVKNGDVVMIGGFLKCGTPMVLIDALLKTDVRDLTLVANDTSSADSDRGKLVVEKRLKKSIVSHIGLNPETGRQMHTGEMEVELIPQGTLAERIRAGGAGIGGILTPTGVGTVVQEGKQVIEVDGKKYLLEKPLRANVALIYGTKADKYGNISFFGTTRNFNPVMATAADIVIAQVDELVDGYLDPNDVVIPGLYVDYLVVKE